MKNLFLATLALFFGLVPGSPRNARAQSAYFDRSTQDPVYLQAALGDSITAAFLANTSLSDKAQYEPPPGTDSEGMKLWVYLRNKLENKKELSWASGVEVPSHYNHLSRHLKKNKASATLMMYNAAVSGAKLSDMVRQADNVIKAMNTGRFAALEYVTVMAGANDACNPKYTTGTPEASMRKSLLAIFARLASIRQPEPVRVLVAGAPRIPDLGMEAIANSSTIGGMSCRTLQQKILKACPSLTSWKTPSEYKERMALVARKNLAIRSAVQEGALRFPNLEIVYSDRMFEKPLKRTDLAIDCFHPNRYAHGLMATILWPDQPWFR